MTLIEAIEHLSITPRHKEEEYEYTSDFLEWYYYNIYRENVENYNLLREIKLDPEYEYIVTLCKTLINMNCAKVFDDDILIEKYKYMKEWTLRNFKAHLVE